MADRIYNLFNFRDLGGYRLKNGGKTQCGAIARSNILLHASEEDIAKLKQLGFTTIVDLRTDMELEKYVHQLSAHPDFTYIHAKCDNWWRDPFYGVEESAMYYMMLVLLYDHLRGVLTAIADAKDGVVFNCHAGKDRTGITAALCLLIAGAEDRDIIDDYAKTYTAYWGDIPEEELLGKKKLVPVGDVMERFLAMFRARFGTVEEYCRIIGLPREKMLTIRRKLTGEE